MSNRKYLKGNIVTARNGHLSYEINSINADLLPVLSRTLQNKFACVAVEEATTFVSEIISDIKLNGIKLGLGWDNCSGAYVMALCDEGDQYIKVIANYLDIEIGKVEFRKYANP